MFKIIEDEVMAGALMLVSQEYETVEDIARMLYNSQQYNSGYIVIEDMSQTEGNILDWPLRFSRLDIYFHEAIGRRIAIRCMDDPNWQAPYMTIKEGD